MCRQVYNGTPVQPFKFWELVASSWMGTRITVSRFHLPLPWCQLFALRLRSSLVGLIVELYIFFWANKGLKQTSLIAEASLQFTRGCWPEGRVFTERGLGAPSFCFLSLRSLPPSSLCISETKWFASKKYVSVEFFVRNSTIYCGLNIHVQHNAICSDKNWRKRGLKAAPLRWICEERTGEQNCSLQKCSRADSFIKGIPMYESKPKECMCTVGK